VADAREGEGGKHGPMHAQASQSTDTWGQGEGCGRGELPKEKGLKNRNLTRPAGGVETSAFHVGGTGQEGQDGDERGWFFRGGGGDDRKKNVYSKMRRSQGKVGVQGREEIRGG